MTSAALPAYGIVIGVLLVLKLILWILWYYFRQRRIKRMIEAGLIRPASARDALAVAGSGRARQNRSYCSSGESMPGVVTFPTGSVTAPGNGHPPSAPMTMPSGPPAYEEVTKGPAGESPPPSYQDAVRTK
ncbi:hypothetical protein BaRGS_00002936 [Batillaria attramentaria]|uniref:ATP synthase F0 subunit 8 n=1 Tax=Batillaria attramentaria TaxID=370345 RepID=A0ABD0M289_9CAEN